MIFGKFYAIADMEPTHMQLQTYTNSSESLLVAYKEYLHRWSFKRTYNQYMQKAVQKLNDSNCPTSGIVSGPQWRIVVLFQQETQLQNGLNLIVRKDYSYKRFVMHGSAQTFRGFVCGTVAGWMQVFVMQPFEVVKVRLVNQSLLEPQYFGIIDCFKRILKEEGAKTFYRGTVSPLIGYGLQGSLSFGSYEFFKDLITYIDQRRYQNEQLIPMSHVFLSGILTGMVSSVVLSPADHIRILLQKQTRAQRYKGSLEAGRDVYRRHNIKGLYLGFTPTFLREVLSNAVYFYSYEYIMRLFAGGKSSSEAPIMGAFLAGGLAGSNSWLLTYPVDYLKTVIQSQDLKHLRYRGVLHCAREQYRKQGYRTFFKGLGITMLRSFPVNGVAFLSFEYVMRIMI